jgi:hypothetical protein
LLAHAIADTIHTEEPHRTRPRKRDVDRTAGLLFS